LLLLLLLPLIVLWPAAPAPAQSGQPMSDEEMARVIVDSDARIVRAFNRHDASFIASAYWDDATDITPDGVVSGRDAIERRLAKFFKTRDPRDLTETIDEIHLSGQFGWLTGHLSYTYVTSPGGKRHTAKGYVGAVLEKRNQVWKARMHVVARAP
jgi:uncharacterized protein (TIGR02246 family)